MYNAYHLALFNRNVIEAMKELTNNIVHIFSPGGNPEEFSKWAECNYHVRKYSYHANRSVDRATHYEGCTCGECGARG